MRKKPVIILIIIVGIVLTLSQSCNINNKNKSSMKTIDNQEKQIVKNKIINEFITKYNSLSESPITDIEKGNIRIKYFGRSYNYYLEMLDIKDTKTAEIEITIFETDENAELGVKGMKNVFHDIMKACINDSSDEEINNCFDELINNQVIANKTYKNVDIEFVPDIELSNGLSRGHIKITKK